MPLVPYLNFNGNCAEAMAFYAEAGHDQDRLGGNRGGDAGLT